MIIFPFENDSRVEGRSFEIERLPNGDGKKPLERFRTVGLNTIPDDVLEGLESCHSNEPTEDSELQEKLQAASLEDGDYDITTRFELNGVMEEITQRACLFIVGGLLWKRE